MAEAISIRIALEGGKEIERQLEDIGDAGKKAFADISKAAEQGGGFKQLDPNEVTAKLKEFGVEGEAAINKIQGAVKSAGRLEGIVQGVSAAEAGVAALGTAVAALAVGFGVLAAALGGALAVLSRFTSQAAETADALRPLANLSGESMQSISALQIAFAQSGVSLQQFAKEFTNLEAAVQEASRTMADDVEQSSQRIQQAHLSEAQAALGVESAELNLRKAVLARREKLTGEVDTDAREAIAARESRLRVEQAEQQLAAARLAQQQAQHSARVAEANDLEKNIQLYQRLGQGASVAFDPLTTQATKTKALLATLAQAGNDWKNVLADILKNSSER